MNPLRRRLLQRAGAALLGASPVLASTAESALKDATGPNWARWHGETPPFSLPDLDGRHHTLADFAGQVVIVNFWASWCEPCREEIPAMSALARQHGAKGLRVLAINYAESRQKVEAFLERWPVEGIVLLDRNGVAPKPWKVAGMPANYLVDRRGVVRYWHLGALDWTQDRITDPVLKLLG